MQNQLDALVIPIIYNDYWEELKYRILVKYLFS